MACSWNESALSAYAAGTLPQEEHRGVEEHLDRCLDCQRAVLGAVRDGEESGREKGDLLSPERISALRGLMAGSVQLPVSDGSASPVQTGTWTRYAAAAALLLGVGLAAAIAWSGGSWGEEDRTGPVTILTESGFDREFPAGERLAVDEGETPRLRFPGGSEVALEPGSEAVWGREGNGNYRLVLHRGEVRADIASLERGFLVETSAGEVRVVGTRFSVRLVPVPPLSEEDGKLQAAVVDLAEGKVELRTLQGRHVLDGAQRALLSPGIAPYPMVSASGPASVRDVEDVWRGCLEAFRRGDRNAVALHVAVLASQGGAAVDTLRDVSLREGEEGEWGRRICRSLEIEFTVERDER